MEKTIGLLLVQAKGYRDKLKLPHPSDSYRREQLNRAIEKMETLLSKLQNTNLDRSPLKETLIQIMILLGESGCFGESRT